MKEELKTLNDIKTFTPNENIVKFHIRQEAIKWAKEDLERLRLRNDFGDFIWDRPIDFIKEWMRRLNITEEELK